MAREATLRMRAQASEEYRQHSSSEQGFRRVYWSRDMLKNKTPSWEEWLRKASAETSHLWPCTLVRLPCCYILWTIYHLPCRCTLKKHPLYKWFWRNIYHIDCPWDSPADFHQCVPSFSLRVLQPELPPVVQSHASPDTTTIWRTLKKHLSYMWTQIIEPSDVNY